MTTMHIIYACIPVLQYTYRLRHYTVHRRTLDSPTRVGVGVIRNTLSTICLVSLLTVKVAPRSQ